MHIYIEIHFKTRTNEISLTVSIVKWMPHRLKFCININIKEKKKNIVPKLLNLNSYILKSHKNYWTSFKSMLNAFSNATWSLLSLLCVLAVSDADSVATFLPYSAWFITCRESSPFTPLWFFCPSCCSFLIGCFYKYWRLIWSSAGDAFRCKMFNPVYYKADTTINSRYFHVINSWVTTYAKRNNTYQLKIPENKNTNMIEWPDIPDKNLFIW